MKICWPSIPRFGFGILIKCNAETIYKSCETLNRAFVNCQGFKLSKRPCYEFNGLLLLFDLLRIKVLWKFVLMTLLILLIIGSGISRIYLGVHFPFDVAGG